MAPEPIRAVISLLSLEPGRPGGSETSARGVLEEYRKGLEGLQASLLATPRVRAAYASFAGPRTSFVVVRGHPGAATGARRAAATALSPLVSVRLRRLLRGRFDVTHYPFTVPLPALPGARVVTLFDVQHLDLPHLWSPVQRQYRRLAYDRAAQSATVVVTASRFARGRLVDLLGVPPERIRVIPLGIDHQAFTPVPDASDTALQRAYRLPDRFLLYPAAMLAHKNHERLLDALAQLADREIALVLTGQAHGRSEDLFGHAGRAGVRNRVRYLGYVDRRLVPALYRRAEALVFPSLYEGFGAPPLEAMACGTPVASSLVASLRESCEGFVQALDPHDPGSIAAGIDAVVGDPAVRARLRSAGLQAASRYTWRQAAEAHVEAYRVAVRLDAP